MHIQNGSNPPSIFGRQLKNYRRRSNLTQESLAAKANYHPTYINMIERGKRIPSTETVLQLAEILELLEEEKKQLIEAARQDSQLRSKSVSMFHKEDWGEAPEVRELYGRREDLSKLGYWVLEEHCRVVAVLGFGGVGKTALSTRLAKQIEEKFNYIFWRSLLNAPPSEGIVQQCIQFLSNQGQFNLPGDLEGQISLLIEYLRNHRCLLVLDNFDAVLRAGNLAGQYRSGYEGYGRLIERLAEGQHQSCLLLTSREKPREIARLEGNAPPVRTLLLPGLRPKEGQEILEDKGLTGSDEAWVDLVNLYSGNPLALKVVSEPIREIFGGNIDAFLKEGETIFGDIHDLLDQQFQRLPDLEQGIMHWLAIEREAVTLDDLQHDMVHTISKRDLLASLDSLRRRSMIETSGSARFTLQPVILEYATDRFIEQVVQEIGMERPELFTKHALIKAQTRDYVRNSQVRVILKPIAERLLATLGKEGLEQKLKEILSKMRTAHPQQPDYVAGSIINILVQLKYNLRGYDFSFLTIWQAYLQGVELPDVSFAHSNLATSLFTEAFGGIISIAFSPDGELLAAGNANGEVRIWQVKNGTPLLTYSGHTDWVRSVVFSPDGKILASGSGDQTIRLWDVNTGQLLKILQGHTNWVWSVSFSPNGKILASGSDDQTIRLWDVNTGQCLKTFQKNSSWVRSVAFSPTGKMLASGNDDQTIRLWDVSTGQCLKTFQGHTDWVRSVAFAPDGRVLVSGSLDQTVRLWDVNTGQCLKTLYGHTNRVYSVAFSPDRKLVASGSHDQTVRLWEVSTGQCIKVLQGHSNWVRSVAFSSDGKLLASGSDDQTVRVWEVSTGQYFKIFQGHTNGVWSTAVSPDGRLLASGADDQAVRLWEIETGQSFKTLQGHTSRVWTVAFSPDGKILASGSDDQTIRLWDVSTGQCLRLLQGHTNRIWSVAFSPDGKILASGSDDQTVRLWDVSTGQRLNIQGHNNRIIPVTFSPDGRLLASGSEDQTVGIWEVLTGKYLETLQGHTNRVWSVAFSPDGKILASGSEDHTVRLWDVSTGQCLNILQRNTGRVWSVAFNSDGKLVANSCDNQICLWEINSGRCLKVLNGHTNRIWSVKFTPGGRVLTSGSEDGTIKFWDVQTGECLQTVRSDRPYERMNITDVAGLTEGQRVTLKVLGAFES